MNIKQSDTIRSHLGLTPFLVIYGLSAVFSLCQPGSSNQIVESTEYRTEIYFFSDFSRAEADFLWRRRMLGEPVPECFPAVQDTNGNWGEPTDGLQLSTRIRHKSYLVGEPVDALILYRNLGSQWRNYYHGDIPSYHYTYILHRGTNVVTWTNPFPGPNAFRASHLGPPNIHDRSQLGFVVRLNQFFDIKRLGEYSFQVSRHEPLFSGLGETNIVSGTAKFRIVEVIPPDEVAAIKSMADYRKELRDRIEEIDRRVKVEEFKRSMLKAETNQPAQK